MTFDGGNFMHSFATWLATAAGVAYATTPRGLFVGQVVEKDAAATYTIATEYGGPVKAVAPLNRLTIQLRTIGADRGARSQAWAMYQALQDTNGQPYRMKTISGYTVAGAADGTYTIVSIDLLQPPALLERDEKGRGHFVFNVEIGVFKAT